MTISKGKLKSEIKSTHNISRDCSEHFFILPTTFLEIAIYFKSLQSIAEMKRQKHSLCLAKHFFRVYPCAQNQLKLYYLRKILDGFNFGHKKCPKIKPSEILSVRKFYGTEKTHWYWPKQTRYDKETLYETLLEILTCICLTFS